MIQSSSYNEVYNSNKSINSPVEKEKLYEELIYYKSLVNNLKKELSILKSQNAKKETEINKKDKVIEDIVIDSQNSIYYREGENLMAKAKEANLISKMKKQFRSLKFELEEKSHETENLKKTLKITKINEMNIEIKTLNEEMSKIKTLYVHSLQQNELLENNLKEMKSLQDNFSKQHFIIVNFQDSLQKQNEEIRIKNLDIELLKDNLNKYMKVIEKLKKDLTYSNNMKEKLFKDNSEKNEVTNLQKKFEKQISDLNKDINKYREISDKKDRTIRELESIMKKSNQHTNKAAAFNYNEIKYIQENPEEKYDNVTLLLKSKLMEALNVKENLEKQVKKLEEKIKNYETDSDHISIRSGANFSQSNRFSIDGGNFMNEDQLADFTYYLIKNFEAKKITHSVAEKTILKDVVTRDATEIDLVKFLNEMIEKISEVLKLKFENDKKNLDRYIKTLFLISEQKIEIFVEKFSSIFYSIKTYKTKEEENFKLELYRNLKNYEEEFKQKINKNDVNSSGLISFDNLKKIFESINFQVDPDLVEFLIYLMKSSETDKMSLYDLNYEVVFSILKNQPNQYEGDILNSKNSSKEKDNEEEEESEIVITSDNFHERVEVVLRQIDAYLKINKVNVREIFKNQLFNLNQLEEFKNQNEQAIHLKDFIDCLNRININLVDIDLYCIYTKLKLVEEYDFVSIKLLEEELSNFNINKNEGQNPNRNVDILEVDMSKII